MKTLAVTILASLFLVEHLTAFPSVEEPEFLVDEGLIPEEISKGSQEKDTLDDSILGENEDDVKGDLRIAEVEKEEEPIPQARVSYSGSQLWRVVAETKDKKRVIGKLRDTRDVAMWGGNVTAFDILVKGPSKDTVKKQLERNGIKFDIIIDDVQKAIDEENPTTEEDEELGNRQARKISFRMIMAWRGLVSLGNRLDLRPDASWGHRMSWSSYHRVNDIHSYLDYLEQTYPNTCKASVIGSSVQGRPLKVIKISNGKPGNKAVWVDGGMHAREWISPATVTYLINHLALNIESEPEEIQNIDWYILPVANPDGYEYSHTVDRLWRKNRARSGFCSGTDLNRNFGYKWGGKGSGKNPCQETFGGSSAFSEPETAAIKNFITTNGANWKGYVSFHSYGQYILFPWGYDRVITTDHQDLLSVAQEAANAIRKTSGLSYTVGPAGSTLYPAAGGSDDWAKGSVGMKYAYTIELRDSGRYGFVLPASYIVPTAQEALAALRVIAKAAYNA